MYKTGKRLTQSIMLALASGVLIGGATTAYAKKCPKPKAEKCYGIAKKKMNDCGTKKHACAALAPSDGMHDEWIFVMKGNCEKIVGGCTAPLTQNPKTKKWECQESKSK